MQVWADESGWWPESAAAPFGLLSVARLGLVVAWLGLVVAWLGLGGARLGLGGARL